MSKGHAARLGSAPGPVEPGEEGAGTDDNGTAPPGAGCKRPVGADDLDISEVALVQHLDDPLVGLCPPAPPRVASLHAVLGTRRNVGLGHVDA